MANIEFLEEYPRSVLAEEGFMPDLRTFTTLTHDQIVTAIREGGVQLNLHCPDILERLLLPEHQDLRRALKVAVDPPYINGGFFLAVKGSPMLEVVIHCYNLQCMFNDPFSFPRRRQTTDDGYTPPIELDVIPFCQNPRLIDLWLKESGIISGQRADVIETNARTSPWLGLTRIVDGRGSPILEIYNFSQALTKSFLFRQFFEEFNLHADIALSPSTIHAMRLIIFADSSGGENHSVYLYDPLQGLADLIDHHFRVPYPELIFNPQRGGEAMAAFIYLAAMVNRIDASLSSLLIEQLGIIERYMAQIPSAVLTLPMLKAIREKMNSKLWKKNNDYITYFLLMNRILALINNAIPE